MDHEIYVYAVFYQPTEKEMENGVKPKFLVKPEFTISKDEETVTKLANINIPKEYSEKLDQVKIAVRPF